MTAPIEDNEPNKLCVIMGSTSLHSGTDFAIRLKQMQEQGLIELIVVDEKPPDQPKRKHSP